MFFELLRALHIRSVSPLLVKFIDKDSVFITATLASMDAGVELTGMSVNRLKQRVAAISFKETCLKNTHG